MVDHTNAFEPTPTGSVDDISERVFGRILVVLVFTFYGGLLARDLFGGIGIVVATCIWFYGVLFAFRVLFRGIEAYLEGGDGNSSSGSAA